jgi:hypothetical protein
LGAGIFRLNTDPSLLSYFPEKLRHDLERIDRTGGSSVMEIVIRDSRGRKLDSNESYERLWQLQSSLEQNPDIGTVISLPILMAEGEEFPLWVMLGTLLVLPSALFFLPTVASWGSRAGRGQAKRGDRQRRRPQTDRE